MWKTILPCTLALTALAAAAPLRADAPAPAGKEEAAKLLAVLKSDAGRKEKEDACRQLARVGGREAVPVLAALLGDEKLAHMARYALEPIPDPSVDEALRAALGKLKGRPLVGVIGSVGVRRDTKAVALLTKLLGDPDAEVAQAAARCLGTLATADAARALERALADAPPANQLALCEGCFRCAEALAAQGRRDEAIRIYDRLRGLKAPHQVRAGALRGAILTRGKDGLPLLREQLHAKDYALFAAAVRAAQELPGPEVTKLLAGELSKLPPDRQIVVRQTLDTSTGAGRPVRAPLEEPQKKTDKR